MPAEAEFFLLDTARKVELYGIRRLPARVSWSCTFCCQLLNVVLIQIHYI